MNWRIVSIATADFAGGYSTEVTMLDDQELEVIKIPFGASDIATPGLARVSIGNWIGIPPGQVKIPKNIMFGYWRLKP